MDTIFLEKFLRKSLDSILGILCKTEKKSFLHSYKFKGRVLENLWDNRHNLVRSDLVAKRISGLETNGFSLAELKMFLSMLT